MAGTPLRPIVRTAQLLCIWFGLSMLIWAVAPAAIERLASGTCSGQTLLAGGLSLFIGLVFLGHGALIRGGKRWPLWTAHLLSVALVTATVGAAMVDVRRLSLFPLVLAAACLVATWFAIQTPRPADDATLARPELEA